MKRLSVYLCFALAVLLAAPAHAYKPQCKDASGRLIQCTGTLDNSQAPAAIAAGTITGTLGVSQGGTGATAVTAHGVMVANGSGTALQSTNAPTTPGQHLIWDGAQWLPGLQTGTVYYFRRDASDIGGGYEQITKTPQTGAEKTASTTLNNASGTVVFDRYATNVGEPGLTQLLAGTWEFDIYAQVSSTAGGNSTNVVIQVYQRTTGGTETLLFSTTSPALDSTSPKLYSWLYTQAADIALDITDRLVVKVAATNSSASNRTVTFYYEGTARYSHFHPPFLSLVDGGSLVTIGGTQTITGAKTFSVAPIMSGANITAATVPAAKLSGGTLGRLLYDDGTGGAWLGAGTSGYLLQSAAPGFAPVWSNTLSGITIPADLNTITNLTTASLAPAFVLGAANGGTGQSTYTAGQTLYATGATTLAKLSIGAANTVYTSTGSAPSWAALPTASSGSSVLGAAFPLTSTDTYQDTGLSVSTPSGGEHQITAQVKATLLATTGSPYATCRLYNVTAGAVLANSELFVAFSPAAGTYGINTATAQKTYTLDAASTIRLECARRQATVWSVSEISSDVDGRTVLSYVKLAS